MFTLLLFYRHLLFYCFAGINFFTSSKGFKAGLSNFIPPRAVLKTFSSGQIFIQTESRFDMKYEETVEKTTPWARQRASAGCTLPTSG